MVFFGGKKTPLWAVLDIESRGLRGVVFEVPAGGSPHIIRKLAYGKPPIVEGGKITHTLHEFLFQLGISIGKVPDRVVISLGPHLGMHEVKDWLENNPKGFTLSAPKDFDNLFKASFESRRKEYAALHCSLLEVFANGYPQYIFEKNTPLRPAGFSTRCISGVEELRFQTLVLSLPAEVGAELADTVRTLGGMPIEFISRVLVYKFLAEKMWPRANLLMIALGGTETSLLLFRNGILLDFVSIGVGFYRIIQPLVSELKLSDVEAEERCRQYEGGILTEKEKADTEVLLVRGVADWSAEFRRVLERFYPLGPLPGEVVVFGEGAKLPPLLRFLSGTPWLEGYSYVSKPIVKVVESHSVFQGDTVGGAFRESVDVPLASLVSYALESNQRHTVQSFYYGS